MKARWAALLLVFGAIGAPCLLAQNTSTPDAHSTGESRYLPVHKFDSSRNAAADIQQAIAEARKTGKRILLDVGGNWCPWCQMLDQLFDQDAALVKLREENFITVAVYCGPDNKNELALAPYPKVPAVPHFFVLDQDGTLLQSQRVVELKTDGRYSFEKMKEFLTRASVRSTEPSR